ncbi:MAG TPA: 16S rRNA (uracil(1498)-N(3))-methyltransferase [Caulobacteraceae bacterium]|nr:16S rRNA (uracil(1498)-N(3))-methyltransferase [Caulobacteraceae bacterium]
MIRLFVHQPLCAGATIEPEPDQARYLTGVMRRQVGDEVLLFNGRDGEWRAILSQIGKRGCTLTVARETRPQAEPPDLELVCALVKRAALETIVEKATELGVRRIRLVTTDFTNADHTNVSRLQAIAAEAAEQTGRLEVPTIERLKKLERLLDLWDQARQLLFCDEAGEAQPLLQAVIAAGPWAVLIGPEGGFSPKERERLRGLPFVTAATLGPRILRADTAAIAALSLWQARLGDWTT